MAIARLRKLVIALLIAAQPISAAFAAAIPPVIAPCPVHAALLPAEASRTAHAGHDMSGQVSSGHEGHAMHGAPAEAPQPQPENAAADFSFVCCVAHVSAVLTPSFPNLQDRWPFAAAFRNEQPLAARDLASVDPPPRILL
jgi:hypothetical protein